MAKAALEAQVVDLLRDVCKGNWDMFKPEYNLQSAMAVRSGDQWRALNDALQAPEPPPEPPEPEGQRKTTTAKK